MPEPLFNFLLINDDNGLKPLLAALVDSSSPTLIRGNLGDPQGTELGSIRVLKWRLPVHQGRLVRIEAKIEHSVGYVCLMKPSSTYSQPLYIDFLRALELALECYLVLDGLVRDTQSSSMQIWETLRRELEKKYPALPSGNLLAVMLWPLIETMFHGQQLPQDTEEIIHDLTLLVDSVPLPSDDRPFPTLAELAENANSSWPSDAGKGFLQLRKGPIIPVKSHAEPAITSESKSHQKVETSKQSSPAKESAVPKGQGEAQEPEQVPEPAKRMAPASFLVSTFAKSFEAGSQFKTSAEPPNRDNEEAKSNSKPQPKALPGSAASTVSDAPRFSPIQAEFVDLESLPWPKAVHGLLYTLWDAALSLRKLGLPPQRDDELSELVLRRLNRLVGDVDGVSRSLVEVEAKGELKKLASVRPFPRLERPNESFRSTSPSMSDMDVDSGVVAMEQQPRKRQAIEVPSQG